MERSRRRAAPACIWPLHAPDLVLVEQPTFPIRWRTVDAARRLAYGEINEAGLTLASEVPQVLKESGVLACRIAAASRVPRLHLLHISRFQDRSTPREGDPTPPDRRIVLPRTSGVPVIHSGATQPFAGDARAVRPRGRGKK